MPVEWKYASILDGAAYVHLYSFLEGEKVQINATIDEDFLRNEKYIQNAADREKVIGEYGFVCGVCFSKIYGEYAVVCVISGSENGKYVAVPHELAFAHWV
jgi:predicted HNH restriction endonuclease